MNRATKLKTIRSAFGLAVSLWCFQPIAFSQTPRNLLVDLPEGRIVGLPIHWSKRDAAILEPSGRIRLFDSREVVDQQILGSAFQPWTLEQVNASLQAELGPGFETLVTGPYVIAAPSGEAARWESRFRALLAGYTRYFEVRGWALRKPDFPLSVVVFPNRAEFMRHGSREVGDGRPLVENLVGMYVPRTNRCLLYNIEGDHSATDLAATEANIVHEAIHQLAYNTGIHERLFQHPLWFVEGLATMFEVPAVYDATVRQSSIESRVHPDKRESLEGHVRSAEQLAAYMTSLIADDELFRTQPEIAYATSWALTYYLAERMPQQYFDYVARQRQRGFQPYVAGDRELDFRESFQTTPANVAPQIMQLLRLSY